MRYRLAEVSWEVPLAPMGFSALATAAQFFLYGKRHMTATGWNRASAKYDVGALDSVDLTGKVFLVTGANSGIGFCLSQYLAKRGATLYMACRSKERAEAARASIVEASGSKTVHTIIADCGVKADVRRIVSHLEEKEEKVDCVVCNAGALLHTRQVTSDGFEVTYATHLLCGSYLLSKEMVPLLEKAAEPRVIFVSSGGMYNTKWPGTTIGTNSGPKAPKYDGQLAYAYAKRGQVLLAERFSKEYPRIKFVTCHPGWTDTPGVEEAFGSQKRFLQPLRTLWQGTEGIAWLCGSPVDSIEGGAFYLDRSPQPKHIAGPFFSEGKFTKNTDAQVDDLMQLLETHASDNPAHTPS